MSRCRLFQCTRKGLLRLLHRSGTSLLPMFVYIHLPRDPFQSHRYQDPTRTSCLFKGSPGPPSTSPSNYPIVRVLTGTLVSSCLYPLEHNSDHSLRSSLEPTGRSLVFPTVLSRRSTHLLLKEGESDHFSCCVGGLVHLCLNFFFSISTSVFELNRL